MSDGVTENSGYPTGKTGLLQTAGNESAAFESGDSSCDPECDHLCRGLTVQYVVNGFGFLFVAGFTASNKLYGVLEIAAVSYGYAITTYVGQNLGAKKYQRIRKGVRSGTYMAFAYFCCNLRCDGVIRTQYIVTVCIRRTGTDPTGVRHCI